MKVMLRGRFGQDNWKNALAGSIILGFVSASAAYAQSLAPGLTGTSKVGDVVQARQLLMAAIEEQMMSIDVASARNDGRLPDLKNRAYMINVLMSAIPHLFAAETKPVESGADPGYDTRALMALWTRFDAFYEASQTAATIALDASQASDMSSFRDLAQKLRAACDSCHADFMASTDPSKP